MSDDPRVQVEAMAAEVRRFSSPPMLAQFLCDEVAQPKGWFSRLFSGPPRGDVNDITLFEDEGFFRQFCLFRAIARDQSLLEVAILPSGGW